MAICINKNSLEYQSLKLRAGISEFILESVCRHYLENYGRFPHLDELPNSNSEEYLKDLIGVTSNRSILISDLLEVTGKETVEEATIELNNQYRDLEIKIIPIEKKALVNITHRPTVNNFEEVEQVIPDTKPNNFVIFNKAINRLALLYGINFIEVTDAELNSDLWAGLIPDATAVNAFVYNGNIYINTDRANIDAPIHEMFHILVGSMRFENPDLYQELIASVENLTNYKALVETYPGRSRNDVNEEIFISELSRYFAGLPSQLMNLNLRVMHELTYNIKRTLDTILMGHDSVKTISDTRLYGMSLKDIVKDVNSTIATSEFKGFVNLEGSELHRKLNNIKADLLRNNTLEEICE